jgi:beta-glucosidase
MPELIFPEGFVWGVAASSYQIEGAWNEDGRGESIWDRFTHTPHHILTGENGDTATDHYHRMPEDVALMKSLGMRAYSFTISWSRIMPDGLGTVNPKGLDFYERLVDALLGAGIKPAAILHHWDMPQELQNRGGWPNRETVNRFVDFAAAVFRRLADRVPTWGTHDEPWVAAFLGYGTGVHAPGVCDYSQAYQAAHHLLLSHGRTVQMFREANYPGEIGLLLNLNGLSPDTDSEADAAAAQRVHDETHALFLDPVFRGTYPERLFEFIGMHQPKIAAGDMQEIHQPIDFLGVNYYNTDKVAFDVFGGLNKARLIPCSAPGWGRTEMGWGIDPDGLRREVLDVSRKYGQPKIYLTENGCAMPDTPDAGGFVMDWDRVRYLSAHIHALHQAIQEGADVHGYYAWSILDNFEWERGYGHRFGLVRVDYTTLRRIPKQSAHWYGEVIRRNGVII